MNTSRPRTAHNIIPLSFQKPSQTNQISLYINGKPKQIQPASISKSSKLIRGLLQSNPQTSSFMLKLPHAKDTSSIRVFLDCLNDDLKNLPNFSFNSRLQFVKNAKELDCEDFVFVILLKSLLHTDTQKIIDTRPDIWSQDYFNTEVLQEVLRELSPNHQEALRLLWSGQNSINKEQAIVQNGKRNPIEIDPHQPENIGAMTNSSDVEDDWVLVTINDIQSMFTQRRLCEISGYLQSLIKQGELYLDNIQEPETCMLFLQFLQFSNFDLRFFKHQTIKDFFKLAHQIKCRDPIFRSLIASIANISKPEEIISKKPTYWSRDIFNFSTLVEIIKQVPVVKDKLHLCLLWLENTELERERFYGSEDFVEMCSFLEGRNWYEVPNLEGLVKEEMIKAAKVGVKRMRKSYPRAIRALPVSKLLKLQMPLWDQRNYQVALWWRVIEF